ncbi:MAG: hypothetical protein EBS81_07845 [Gammaproteobacteria bacterium]|nr:hypothetical protein [Gammaproteobacteria bacterium]
MWDFFPLGIILIRVQENSGIEQGNTVVVAALRKIMRPLVKFLIANQITYPHLINLLKSSYVDVAEKNFIVEGKKQTDSRINLLTGVHRKDVKRLRSEQVNPAERPANISIGAQLIARWVGDKSLLNEDGSPKTLPLQDDDEFSMNSFEGLVANIAKGDIRPRVVLDELMRLDMVELDPDHNVILKTKAFTPNRGQEEKLYFFGKNIQDHLCAGVHNLSGEQPPFFDRSVYYDELSESSIQELNVLADSLGMDALIKMNEKALALQKADKGDLNARYRMNFGIFNYNTDYAVENDKAISEEES